MTARFGRRLLFGTLLVGMLVLGLWWDAARHHHGARPIAAPLLITLFTLPAVRELIDILARAGLIKVREEKDAAGRARAAVAEWRAFASTTGGSCAVMLRDPNDKDALTRALAAFAEYAGVAAGKKSVVLRVLNQREVGRAGANPKAAFMLEAAEGYSFDARLDGEPIVEGERRGQHGYLPTTPDYRASFIASGAGIDKGEDLGEIRMIDIGPTIARALGLTLRHADGRALKLR